MSMKTTTLPKRYHEAVLRWLYEPDDTLPGATPAAALSGDQAREVKRRAQAQGF